MEMMWMMSVSGGGHSVSLRDLCCRSVLVAGSAMTATVLWPLQ